MHKKLLEQIALNIDKPKRLEKCKVKSVFSEKVYWNKFKSFGFDRKIVQKYRMPLCHFDSYNLWILKPTHLNRGRGIHVFRDL